jgi:integrase
VLVVVVVKACVLGWQPDAYDVADVVENAGGAADQLRRRHRVSPVDWITVAVISLIRPAKVSRAVASDGVVALDADTVAVMKAWRRAQVAERLSMGEQWTDTGLVFTFEDGTAYHPDRVNDIFEWDAFRAGLPLIRFHDLRHCAASIAHAAGASMKEIQA